MAEEQVDTPEVPVEDAEPSEPTETPEAPPEEPAYVTAQDMQAALEKQDSSFRSWLGRRDKETFEHIGTVINERMSQRPPETNDEMSTRLLETPREVIRSEFEAFEAERTQKQTTHMNTTMETVGQLMEADPLYTDKDLGNEVVAEIKTLVQTGKIDQNVPPSQAGRIILGDAVANVFRTRQNLKVNPLSANTPNGGAPNLSPPSKPSKNVAMPKLDDMTKKMAEKWGYKQEDLARIYGE